MVNGTQSRCGEWFLAAQDVATVKMKGRKIAQAGANKTHEETMKSLGGIKSVV